MTLDFENSLKDHLGYSVPSTRVCRYCEFSRNESPLSSINKENCLCQDLKCFILPTTPFTVKPEGSCKAFKFKLK